MTASAQEDMKRWLAMWCICTLLQGSIYEHSDASNKQMQAIVKLKFHAFLPHRLSACQCRETNRCNLNGKLTVMTADHLLVSATTQLTVTYV